MARKSSEIQIQTECPLIAKPAVYEYLQEIDKGRHSADGRDGSCL